MASQRDKRIEIAILLRMGKASNEIISLMNCDRKTVYNIKKRLEARDESNALEHKPGAGPPKRSTPKTSKRPSRGIRWSHCGCMRGKGAWPQAEWRGQSGTWAGSPWWGRRAHSWAKLSRSPISDVARDSSTTWSLQRLIVSSFSLMKRLGLLTPSETGRMAGMWPSGLSMSPRGCWWRQNIRIWSCPWAS